MTDKSHVRFQNQRNQEPKTIDTDPTGTNPAGNFLNDGKMGLPNPDQANDIWIEQEDQAKQAMARRDDLSRAQAAPGHPYIRDSRGGGEVQ